MRSKAEYKSYFFGIREKMREIRDARARGDSKRVVELTRECEGLQRRAEKISMRGL